MANIDQHIDTLKKLWQDQKFKENNMNEVLLPDSFIVRRLKSFEKLQLRINTGKLIGIILIMGSFTWYLFHYSKPSFLVVVSLFWITACLAVFIIIYWRKQFQANQLNFSLQTNDFIDFTIDKINEQAKIFRTIFPFLVTTLIIGVNLLYLGILTDSSTGLRLIYHLLVSLVLVSFIPLGIKIRKWKFKKENQPVIDDLLNFKEEMKE